MIRKEYSLLLSATLAIIFFHIYHETVRIKLSYAKQKLEHTLAEIKSELENTQLQLHALKNRESTTKWAHENAMQEVKLSHIKKWQPTE